MGPGVIDADAQHLEVRLVEARLHLLVDRELVRTDRAEVTGIEREQDASPTKVREGDLLALVVRQREVGCLLASGNQRRRPRSETTLRYRSRSELSRYLSSRRRLPTIISSPRREWWSLPCVRRCSVRWLMRSVCSAI